MKRQVTVLMPNYNHARYLPQSLSALFSQSLSPLEVIVIDDASTDESVSIVRQFQEMHPQLVLIELKSNQGPVKALNIGLQAAKGDYLAFCSADDQALPGFFEQGSHWLNRYPKTGICCSDPSFFENREPYLFRRAPIAHYKEPTLLPSSTIQKTFLTTRFWLPSHASLFRKKAVLETGGFNESLHHLADWYLNLQIALKCDTIYVPASFGAFRLSQQSYGARWNRSWGKKIAIYDELFSSLAKEPIEFQRKFRQSGVLGLVSSDCLLYLLTKNKSYFPRAFFRKGCNFIRKFL